MLKPPLFAALLLAATTPASAAWASDSRSPTLADLLSRAERSNPDLVEARMEAERAESSRKASRSPFFPELGVASGWERWSSDSDLLTGGGLSAFAKWNLFRGTRDLRELQIRTAEADFGSFAAERARARVRRQVAALYFELLFLQGSLEIKQDALKLNATQTQMAERRVGAGLASQADTLEFASRHAGLSSDIAHLRAERESAAAELARWLGETEPALLEVSGDFPPPGIEIPAEKALETAKTLNPEIREAERDVEIAILRHQATLGGWLPTLDLDAGYGTLLPSEREITGTPSAQIALQLRLPLFSGMESVHERSAQARALEKAEARLRRALLEQKARIESALARSRSLRERIALEDENANRARKYYEVTSAEYRRGVKNSPDLAGAGERLFDSRTRLLQLKRDAALARLALAEAMGTNPDLKN